MKIELAKSRQLIVSRLNAVFLKLRLSLASKVLLLMGMLSAMPYVLFAQNDTTKTRTVDMATTMRSNGKIYVVVAVLVIILLGLFFYLIRLDRKIGKLEKDQ